MDSVFFHSQNRKLGGVVTPTNQNAKQRHYFGIDSQYSYVVILSYNHYNSRYELLINDSYGDDGHWRVVDVTSWMGNNTKKGNSFFTLLPINNFFYACWLSADTDNLGSVYNTSGSNTVKNPRIIMYNITNNSYKAYLFMNDSNGNTLTSPNIRKFYFLTTDDWLWIEDTNVYYRGANWKTSNVSNRFYQIDTSGDDKSMTSFAGNNYLSPNNYGSGILTNLKFVMRTKIGGFDNYSEYPDNYSDKIKVTQSKLLFAYRLYGDKYVLIGDKEPGRIDGGFDIAGTADFIDNVGHPKNLIINLADTSPNKVLADAHYYWYDGTEVPFNGSFSGAYYGSYDPNNPMDSSFGRETYKSCRAISAMKMSHRNKDNVANNNYYMLQYSTIKREIHLNYDSIGGVLGSILHALGTAWTSIADAITGGNLIYSPYSTFRYFYDDQIYMDDPIVTLFKTSDLVHFNEIRKTALRKYPIFDFTVSKNTDRLVCLGYSSGDSSEINAKEVVYFTDDDFNTYSICDFQFNL